MITHHEIRVGGKTLRYTATTGMMPLKNNDTGEVEAHIFYMAYTLDGQTGEHRPLTFSFNGGPGFGLRLAASGRHRPQARAHAAGRHDAAAALPADR